MESTTETPEASMVPSVRMLRLMTTLRKVGPEDGRADFDPIQYAAPLFGSLAEDEAHHRRHGQGDPHIPVAHHHVGHAHEYLGRHWAALCPWI